MNLKKSVKPKILFVVTTPLTANVFLLGHFQSLSIEFEIFLCVNSNLDKLSPQLKQYVEIIHIEFQRKISIWRDLKSLIGLIFIVSHVKPLVIHSVTPKAGLLGMVAGFFARVPFRWHTFTGQVWVTRKFISRFFLKFIDKCIAYFSTKIFTDSESQRQLLINEKIVFTEKISVLGFGSIAGVDIDRFKKNDNTRLQMREKLAYKIDSFIYLFVGRLVVDKGIFDLINAFTIVSKKIKNIELWLVGPDEDNLQTRLQEMARLNNLSIRFIGKSEFPEIYMMSADIFILPSYREGFGSVIIEAASCNIPAIAYRIDGVVDAIENGVTGELIEPYDIEALSNSMLSFAENSNKSLEMGRNARRRVERYFRSEEITKAWLAQYNSILF